MDALAYADELARRDEEVAAATAAVAEAQRLTDEVRRRAQEVADFRAALPELRTDADAALAAADEEAAARRRELVVAEADEGDDAERRAAAARDLVALAERRLAHARAQREELVRRAARSEAQAEALEREVRELSARLAGLPRVSATGAAGPEPGLDGVLDWGSRARAALFVVRGGLDRERELVVREANELAQSVLGEPLAATSVRLVRERVAAAAGPR